MPHRRPCPAAALFWPLLATLVLPAATRGGEATILDGRTPWRALYSWNAPLIETKQGTQERRLTGRNVKSPDLPDFRFLTLYPPEGWAAPDFDDSGWARRHFVVKWESGEWDYRARGGAGSPYLRQLSLRGKFTVADPSALLRAGPAKAGPLSLTVVFRGGAVVYLNGKELARAHLPPGKVEPGCPAEMYPPKAYLKDTGKPWHWWNDREAIAKEAYPLRARRLDGLAVPAGLLRKGTNVLALEIHAAPYPEAFAAAHPEWATCGLVELRLQAERPEGLEPNVARPAGLRVWNTGVAEEVHDVSWGDPHEPLRPVAIVVPRNGCGSGRVVVGSDKPLKGLRATLGGFVGPAGAKLPAEAVQVWYGRFDAPRASRWGGIYDWGALQWGLLQRLRDDALVETPPDEVPLAVKPTPMGPPHGPPTAGDVAPGALQPVWVVAEVPRDAAPGDYRGTLTIAVEGHQPVEVPVELKVVAWTLPDPADYACWIAMIESPEAAALHYGVPLWSPEHCKLVARSLEWVGKLGPKVLYLPLGAESQYGNAQSLVLWVKGADGGLRPDFRNVETYLDLAVGGTSPSRVSRRGDTPPAMGKPRFVVAGVWDSCMHVSVPAHLRRPFPRISVLEPATGKVANADGPKHGTPEAAAFWKPVLDGLRERLAKRGLGDALLLGYCADRQPDKATVGVFHEIAPDVGWQANRHPPLRNDTLAYEGGTVPIRFQANVWGGWDNWDPATRRVHGWKFPAAPSLRTWLDRGLFDACPVAQFRTAPEQALLADRRGLGQIGADFWPVKGPDGKPAHTMYGRFPSTSEGNLGIYSGQLLYPGPDGPAPTARYQVLRENVQECEARIFLEGGHARPPLPADLEGRVQDILDERTRWHRLMLHDLSPETYISWPASGWEGRRLALFEAAAEAERARAVQGQAQ
ncbi:MAG TPA: glycoside hydrolase domain-containing protein [Planctomycetota bacterium]|nr:glycoside hydrolase domain-containing protein [Planctomycetota bacterium]